MTRVKGLEQRNAAEDREREVDLEVKRRLGILQGRGEEAQAKPG